MWTKLLAPALLATLGLGTSAQALSLDIQVGKLVGASDVNVAGTLYDVTFADGSCFSLFDGCDSLTDLDFSSQAAAEAAADALLDQVFVDQGANTIDSDPSLTLGCGTLSRCQTFVPYALSSGSVSVAFADNQSIEAADNVLGALVLPTFDTTTGGPGPSVEANFAQFAVASAAIPLPASALLLMAGLGGFGLLRRRGSVPRSAV